MAAMVMVSKAQDSRRARTMEGKRQAGRMYPLRLPAGPLQPGGLGIGRQSRDDSWLLPRPPGRVPALAPAVGSARQSRGPSSRGSRERGLRAARWMQGGMTLGRGPSKEMGWRCRARRRLPRWPL